ncbi:sulfotransferase 6B1-like [Glandiceps talaboti]
MASVYQHIPTHDKEPIIDGIMYPTMVFEDYLKRIKTMEVRHDDVWLMSYPKAGIHWMKAILYQLYNYDTPEGRGEKKPPGLDSFILFAEYLEFSTGKLSVDILPTIPTTQRRFIATHLLPHTMPTDYFVKKPKTIHLVRNPKDTAVSLFHFMNRVPFFTAPESWESLLDDYMKGNVVYGKHDEYMKSWWVKRNEIDMMFVSFEEMKRVRTTGEWKTKFTVAQSEMFDDYYNEKMKSIGFEFEYE